MSTRDGFVRSNVNHGAVLNTDVNGLQAYKLQKNKNKEIEQMKIELRQFGKLRDDVAQIKQMMSSILERLK